MKAEQAIKNMDDRMRDGDALDYFRCYQDRDTVRALEDLLERIVALEGRQLAEQQEEEWDLAPPDCPFCGHTMEVATANAHVWWTECGHCDAAGPNAPTHNAAIAAVNSVRKVSDEA